jgi:hypothetical protein
MKHNRALLLFALAVGLALVETGELNAQTGDNPHPEPPAQRPTDATFTTERESLEAGFKATLENATFLGRWCSIQDGKMGPEQQDKYTIVGATKVGGDTWLIHARIQYGGREFVAPLPVQVKWAGDTAVIVVDRMAMPGGTREYSARVLVHDDTYAGTWSGGDQAGLLKGIITRE